MLAGGGPMNATLFRRILFSLVPVELAVLLMLALGVNLPAALRLIVLLLLTATVTVEASIWILTFRQKRGHGLPSSVAAKTATRHVVGETLRGFITAELGLLTSIVRLVTRRPKVPEGTETFTYHQQASPMMWLMAGLILVEVIVLHFVIPWETVRLIVLVLSVYSLIWVIGLIAGFIVHPHLMYEDALVVRHGHKVSLLVPIVSIERIEISRHGVSGTRSIRYDIPQAEGPAGTLHLSQGGQTNVELFLTRPIDGGASTRGNPVENIRLWIDDPRRLIRDVSVKK